jgi:hypothetical protein
VRGETPTVLGPLERANLLFINYLKHSGKAHSPNSPGPLTTCVDNLTGENSYVRLNFLLAYKHWQDAENAF